MHLDSPQDRHGVSSAQHLFQNQKQVALESDGRTRTRSNGIAASTQADSRDSSITLTQSPTVLTGPVSVPWFEVDHDECAVRPPVDSAGDGEEAEHFGVWASALENLVDRGFRVRRASPAASRGDLEAVQLPACGVRDDQIRKRLEPDQRNVSAHIANGISWKIPPAGPFAEYSSGSPRTGRASESPTVKRRIALRVA